MDSSISFQNSNLDDRTAVADILAIANAGPSGRRIVNCGGNTLNTPYKAGLTTLQSGTAVVCMSSANYGTILYVAAGAAVAFLRSKVNGTWGDWKTLLSNDDIQIARVTASTTSGSNVVTATVPGLKVGMACIVTYNTSSSNYILNAYCSSENTLSISFANNFASAGSVILSVVFKP